MRAQDFEKDVVDLRFAEATFSKTATSSEGRLRGRQEATRQEQGRNLKIGTDAHGDFLLLPLVGWRGRVSSNMLNSRWRRRVAMDWHIAEACDAIGALSQATARRVSNALSDFSDCNF